MAVTGQIYSFCIIIINQWEEKTENILEDDGVVCFEAGTSLMLLK
jgi:hypothetical protein